MEEAPHRAQERKEKDEEEQERVPLPTGLQIRMGGKWSGLNFDNLEELIKDQAILQLLSTEAGCKDLSDQYEVWVTEKSLKGHLQNKSREQPPHASFYYVAHGSANDVRFDNKGPKDVASYVKEELGLEGEIRENIYVRLVGCYSRPIAEQVSKEIKKDRKIKLGDGGSITVKGTEGMYFRSGGHSNTLAKTQEGEAQAKLLFDASDAQIKIAFGDFKKSILDLAANFADSPLDEIGVKKQQVAPYKKKLTKTPSLKFCLEELYKLSTVKIHNFERLGLDCQAAVQGILNRLFTIRTDLLDRLLKLNGLPSGKKHEKYTLQ